MPINDDIKELLGTPWVAKDGSTRYYNRNWEEIVGITTSSFFKRKVDKVYLEVPSEKNHYGYRNEEMSVEWYNDIVKRTKVWIGEDLSVHADYCYDGRLYDYIIDRMTAYVKSILVAYDFYTSDKVEHIIRYDDYTGDNYYVDRIETTAYHFTGTFERLNEEYKRLSDKGMSIRSVSTANVPYELRRCNKDRGYFGREIASTVENIIRRKSECEFRQKQNKVDRVK